MTFYLKDIRIENNSFFSCFGANTFFIEIFKNKDSTNLNQSESKTLSEQKAEKIAEFHLKAADKSIMLNMLLNIEKNETISFKIHKKNKVIINDTFTIGDFEFSKKYKNLDIFISYEYVGTNSFNFCEDPDNYSVENDSFTVNEFCSRNVEIRRYKGRRYLVDLSTFETKWLESNIYTNKKENSGWEEIRLKNGLILWINHAYQIVLPAGKTANTFKNEILRKKSLFYEKLITMDTFKYLIFTKFTLYTQRNFFVQSSASYFLRVSKNYLQRQLNIQIGDEIGEDEGGIKSEFFNEAAYEIAKDKRMKFSGNFLDVNPEIYKSNEKPDLENKKYYDNLDLNQRELDLDKSIQELYKSEEFLINLEEVQNIKKRFTKGLSFSKISNLKFSKMLKFWETHQKKNESLIEDTPKEFYEKNEKQTNLLTDDEFYAYVGIFLAMCILNKELLPIKFSKSFLENLFECNYTISHIQDVEVQKNMLYVLRNELSDEELDLFDNPLIKKDKKAYILSQIYEKLFFSKKRAYDIIFYFFYSLIPSYFPQIFEYEELYYLINGEEEIQWKDLIASFIVHPNKPVHDINYFINILKRKDKIFYRKLIKFITGSECIPFSGDGTNFSKMYIEQTDERNALFRASTCVKMLFIGTYESEEKMEEILDFCINNTEGFHKI